MAISVNQRVNKYRAALRAAGFRPIQIWVPDTRRPKFQEACRRQSASLVDDLHENNVLDWIEGVEDQDGWKA